MPSATMQSSSFSSGIDTRLLAEFLATGLTDTDIAEVQDAFDWSGDNGYVSVAAVHGHALGAGLQLAEPFAISLPAVSKHLKVLQRAGLITQGRQAQWRPCRLVAAPLKDVADWVDRYRGFWEQSFDRLDDYLQELQQTEQPGDGQR